MDVTDELKQKELIVFRELQRKIKEATTDLEQFQKSRESIKKEFKELASSQEKLKKEYQDKIISGQKLDKKISLSESDLRELEIKQDEVISQLDSEIIKKTKDLNNFKNSKKDFVDELKRRERELQQKDKESSQRLDELSREQAELKEKEKLAENRLISAQKQEKVANDLQSQLRSTQGQIERKKGIIKADLDRIEQMKGEKEQELEEQQNLTKTLKNKTKILYLKIEAQDKREKPIRELESRLKQFEAKLLDDRNMLNRAWAELTHKGGKK